MSVFLSFSYRREWALREKSELGRFAQNLKKSEIKSCKSYGLIFLEPSSHNIIDKKTLLYKKLLYHLFVCLMAMRTSLRKRNKKRLRLEKGRKGLGKSGKKD